MDPEQIPLRDLHLPDPVGWWPPAPGWWVLFGLVALAILFVLYRAWVRWRMNAARRIALAELARLEGSWRNAPNPVLLATRLSELLRRTMLAYAPRKDVAGLTGQAWLQWLDRGLDEKPFTEGPGRLIRELPYRRADERPGEFDVDGLLEAVRQRLETPLPELP
jgi:hypothetical protein